MKEKRREIEGEANRGEIEGYGRKLGWEGYRV